MDKKVVLLYSGGVESTFLLAKFLTEKRKFIAVTVNNGLLPQYQKKLIQDVVEKSGIDHIWLHFDFKKLPAMRRNLPARCYFCKREMFKITGKTFPDAAIITGTTSADLPRPGRMAEVEYNVGTPLMNSELTRREMIDFITQMGIPFIKNNTCLATRFPEFYEITDEDIAEIDKLETALYNKLGVPLRLRKREQFFILEIEANMVNEGIRALQEAGILEKTLIKTRKF